MESLGAVVNRISYAAPSTMGPAEIAAQCSPNTSAMSRWTVPPWTATSVYSVTLPSGSRTTSAMARILPRKASWPSLQDEVHGQAHAERARRQLGRKWHAEPARRLQRGLVQDVV